MPAEFLIKEARKLATLRSCQVELQAAIAGVTVTEASFQTVLQRENIMNPVLS
jgi:hypothetical protein